MVVGMREVDFLGAVDLFGEEKADELVREN